MSITITVIGSGEMGSAIGARLVRGGARVLTDLNGRSEASRKRAREAGMHDATASAIRRSRYLLSILPPAQAEETAERFSREWALGPDGPVFVDCNAVSPDTARRIAAIAGAHGSRCVDGAIIGAPGALSGPGPILYLSGEEPDDVAALTAAGLRVKAVSGGPGAASALKMCYSGINKGLTALAAAMVLAARRAGVDAALRDELADSQPGLLAKFTHVLPDMYSKAYRWEREMQEIADFAGAGDDATRTVFEGMGQLYSRLAADYAGQGAEVETIDAFLRRSPR